MTPQDDESEANARVGWTLVVGAVPGIHAPGSASWGEASRALG